MADDDEFSFDAEDDEDEFDTDSDDDDDEYDDDELDAEARLAEAREVARLRWEIDGLKDVHRTLRDHYRLEMRSLIEPLVDKHRLLKDENRQLQARLADMIQARHDADSGIKDEIAQLRAAHEDLAQRAEVLEVDNRLGRRLQAELNEADAKIAKREAETAELMRDCRKLEHVVAERDREQDGVRQEIAAAEATGREWRERYEQALIDNAAEIAMYQEQITETTEQTTVLEMRAREFDQVDQLLPALYTTLRAEKDAIDGIEALLFPREPEPVLVAAGAVGDDWPEVGQELPADPTSVDDGLGWDDPTSAPVTADDMGWQAPIDTDDEGGLAPDPSWPDAAMADPEAVPFDDAAWDPDSVPADLGWDPGAPSGETAWDAQVPTGDGSWQMAADGLGHDGAYSDPLMGDAGFGEAYTGPDTPMATDLAGWDMQSDSYADQDGEPTPYAQHQHSDFPADEMPAEAGTPSVYGNETEAWPASGYATGADIGLDADVDWQGGQPAQTGYGLAIPDTDGPSVGAVAIPGFDQP